MGVVKKLISYVDQYGVRSLAALVREKLFIDKRRFAIGAKERPDLPELIPTDVPAVQPEATGKIKRVLYLLHGFYPERRGGTERFVLNMALEGKARGEDAAVLAFDFLGARRDYPESVGDILLRRYEYMGIRCIGIRYKKAPLGLFYKRISPDGNNMRALARYLIRSEDIQFIHAAYPQPFAPFLAEARALGVPYAVTLTDFAVWCHYATAVRRDGVICSGSQCGRECKEHCRCSAVGDFEKRYRAASEMILGARALAVPSRYCARVMKAELPQADVRIIPHGIGEELSYVERSGAPRRFLYAGKLAPHKGVELLIRAFTRLDTEGVTLRIVGTGSSAYEKHLRSLADGRVDFAGAAPPERMPEIYAEADCIVVPSLFPETYCFALREALATGAVAVAADIGALSEAIREGENGFLFTAGDVDSLAEALERASALVLPVTAPDAPPRPSDEHAAYRAYLADTDRK